MKKRADNGVQSNDSTPVAQALLPTRSQPANVVRMGPLFQRPVGGHVNTLYWLARRPHLPKATYSYTYVHTTYLVGLAWKSGSTHAGGRVGHILHPAHAYLTTCLVFALAASLLSPLSLSLVFSHMVLGLLNS